MRNITCIFSDDFRKELNGKYSLIGIYGNVLNINSDHKMLPKISVTVYIKTTSSDRLTGISLLIRLNGKQLSRTNINEETLNRLFAEAKATGTDVINGICNTNLEFISLPLEKNFLTAEVLLNGQVAFSQNLTINRVKKN